MTSDLTGRPASTWSTRSGGPPDVVEGEEEEEEEHAASSRAAAPAPPRSGCAGVRTGHGPVVAGDRLLRGERHVTKVLFHGPRCQAPHQLLLEHDQQDEQRDDGDDGAGQGHVDLVGWVLMSCFRPIWTVRTELSLPVTSRGHRYWFHADRKLKAPRAASAGRASGDGHRPEEPEVPVAVQLGRLRRSAGSAGTPGAAGRCRTPWPGTAR